MSPGWPGEDDGRSNGPWSFTCKRCQLSCWCMNFPLQPKRSSFSSISLVGRSSAALYLCGAVLKGWKRSCKAPSSGIDPSRKGIHNAVADSSLALQTGTVRNVALHQTEKPLQNAGTKEMACYLLKW